MRDQRCNSCNFNVNGLSFEVTKQSIKRHTIGRSSENFNMTANTTELRMFRQARFAHLMTEWPAVFWPGDRSYEAPFWSYRR